MPSVAGLFIGSSQSKYAGLAILVSLIAVATAMLVGKESISLGQKFVAVLLMFLLAVPGVALALFQLTCLVTGSSKDKNWGLCGIYAWVGSALMILYAVIIVAFAVMSILNGTSIQKDLAMLDGFQAAAGAPALAGPALDAPMPKMPVLPEEAKKVAEAFFAEATPAAEEEQAPKMAEDEVPVHNLVGAPPTTESFFGGCGAPLQ